MTFPPQQPRKARPAGTLTERAKALRLAESGQIVVARFGDEVTLKRLWRINKREVELRLESYNAAHEVMRLDLAKHILDIDGVVVGAVIAGPPVPPDEQRADDGHDWTEKNAQGAP